jgi:hypothetical protein
MTAKEKAAGLLTIFAYSIKEEISENGFIANMHLAKSYAIGFVEYLIKAKDTTTYPTDFWQEVKQELEEL